jgi:hypothetical protein
VDQRPKCAAREIPTFFPPRWNQNRGGAPAPARRRHGRDIPTHSTTHNALIRDSLIDALSTLNAMDMDLPRDTMQKVLATASGGSASTATKFVGSWCRFRLTSLVYQQRVGPKRSGPNGWLNGGSGEVASRCRVVGNGAFAPSHSHGGDARAWLGMNRAQQRGINHPRQYVDYGSRCATDSASLARRP